MDWQQEIFKTLKERPRLSTWPDSELRELAKEVDTVESQAGNSVFEPGVRSDDAYIIYEGQVRQSVLSAAGEEFWYRLLGKGDIFAQQSLFRGQHYATTARAEQDSTLFRISATTLSKLLVRHPELWSIFYASSAPRLQAIPLFRSLDDDQIDRLSAAVEEKEFSPGQRICTATDPNGGVWLIDTGQVKITQQMETVFSGSSTLAVTTPSAQVQATQGFRNIPQLLTAGNFFVGGLMAVPSLLTVTAEAATQAKLLRVPGSLIEQLSHRFPDVTFMLTHRVDILQRLIEALKQDEVFKDLNPQQWQELANITGWEHVPSGLDVTRQGQYGTKLYVLSDGAALVRSTDDNGRDRPQHYLQPGTNDYYGTTALLHGDKHGATVRSVADQSRSGHLLDGTDWFTVQRDDMRYVLQSAPELWEKTQLWHLTMVRPTQKEFKWQEDEEKIELVKRRSLLWLWLRLAAAFGVAALAAGLVLFLSGLAGWNSLSAVITLLVLLIPPTIWFIIDYFNDYYVITNRRVVRHDAVLLIYENQLEASLERIQDITTRGSLFAKIFNYAHLDIRTAGVGSIAFDMVQDPEEVEAKIRELQGQMKAGSKAEQIENLRNQVIKALKMRLTPSIPSRVLPVTLVVAPQLTTGQRMIRTMTDPFRRAWRWLKSVPGKIELALLYLLPRRSRERVLKERKAKALRSAAQMQDVVVYRKSVFFLLWAAIIPIVVISAAIILRLILHERILSVLPPWLDPFYAVMMLGMIFWLWFRVENWRNDKYILTKTHIIDIYALPLGLFEQRRQAEWDRVQNANYTVPSFWANLFNYGDVIVETAAVEGRLDFIHVPNPRKVQQEIVLRIGEARQTQERRERDRRQTDLSETLQIYNELIQEWSLRNQAVGQSAPTEGGVPPPVNGGVRSL
jgi:CRP-like cAMP-binding protein